MLNAKWSSLSWRRIALASMLLVGVSGCYVEAEGPPPPPGCYAAVWIRGHHDREGFWHEGHYRCRGWRERRVVVVAP